MMDDRKERMLVLDLTLTHLKASAKHLPLLGHYHDMLTHHSYLIHKANSTQEYNPDVVEDLTLDGEGPSNTSFTEYDTDSLGHSFALLFARLMTKPAWEEFKRQVESRMYPDPCVPDLPKKLVATLAETIQPLVRKDGELHTITMPDLHSTAYTWDPKLVSVIDPATLEPIEAITTYHKYGYYGFFKPSVAEVICCIPERLRDEVTHFEIVEQPDVAADFNKHRRAFDLGLHTATTQLYRLKKDL